MKQTLTVWSPQLRTHRLVDVYLPASYDSASRRRYPVVYLQDGQNLSDPATAFAGTWELEAAIGALAQAGLELIAVGVHNGGERRLFEYGPFPDPSHGVPVAGGDRYLRFVIETIKPRIDTRYRAAAAPSSTAIVGSSMGGLIALYAFLTAPRTFGLAGALSPSIWFGGRALLDVAARRARPRGRRRIYLDAGTDEGSETLRDARALARILRARGYRAATLRYIEATGHQHREQDWARRLPGALAFLLAR